MENIVEHRNALRKQSERHLDGRLLYLWINENRRRWKEITAKARRRGFTADEQHEIGWLEGQTFLMRTLLRCGRRAA